MTMQEFIKKTKSSIPKDAESVFVRAPGRINLIGEHTDYNLGLCFPAAIEQSVSMLVCKSDQMKIVALDRAQEYPNSSNEKPDWMVYFEGVYKVLEIKIGKVNPVNVYFSSTIPSGAGLSSSSAITCAFIAALNELYQWAFSKDQLCSMAVQAERNSGLEGGMMDQITIFNGIKNHALLINCKNWSFDSYKIDFGEYGLLIIDTGVKHKLVDSDYNLRSRMCKAITAKLQAKNSMINSISDITTDEIAYYSQELNIEEQELFCYVIEENKRVIQMKEAIVQNDILCVGKLLFEGHEGLETKYKVSCDELDFLIDYAKNSKGVLGARMMGGGFGGSTIHLLPLAQMNQYMEKISESYYKKFNIYPHCFPAQIEDGLRIVEANSI